MIPDFHVFNFEIMFASSPKKNCTRSNKSYLHDAKHLNQMHRRNTIHMFLVNTAHNNHCDHIRPSKTTTKNSIKQKSNKAKAHIHNALERTQDGDTMQMQIHANASNTKQNSCSEQSELYVGNDEQLVGCPQFNPVVACPRSL